MTPTQFADSAGNVWDCKINLGKALLVDRSDFSLYLPETQKSLILSKFDKDSITLILTDQALMFALIGVLVRDQAKKKIDIDPDENEALFQERFAGLIDGSCIEPARKALAEALGDFFQAARTVLSDFLKRVTTHQMTIETRLMNEVNPLLDKKLDREIDSEIERLKGTLSETLSASPQT